MQKPQLILTPFKKAVTSLEKALEQPLNEFTRDATIQRFEYTFELSWKMLKRYLSLETGLRENNIKNLFREAGRQNLVGNVEHWFKYHEARNLTSHTYNENMADETYQIAQQFAVDARELLETLEKELGNSA